MFLEILIFEECEQMSVTRISDKIFKASYGQVLSQFFVHDWESCISVFGQKYLAYTVYTYNKGLPVLKVFDPHYVFGIHPPCAQVIHLLWRFVSTVPTYLQGQAD